MYYSNTRISLDMTHKVTATNAKLRFAKGLATQLFITKTEVGYEIWILDHCLFENRLIPVVGFVEKFGEPIVYSTLKLAQITADKICDKSKISSVENLDGVNLN